MARLTGGSFKRLSPEDIRVRRSTLNQLVDVIQEDVSGSATRRKYQVFVTGGVGPGVTSSLFQTVYDQDFSLQTANPLFDLTVGCYVSSSLVVAAGNNQKDSADKLLFPSQSLMMREKVDIYKQFAANLLGDAGAAFFAPFGSTATSPYYSTSVASGSVSNQIDEALFMTFKRLFARDRLKRETFACRIYASASRAPASPGGALGPSGRPPVYYGPNLSVTSVTGATVYSDIGSSENVRSTFGGGVGNIVNAANTALTVGLIFYDQGTIVWDMKKIFAADQHVSGVIDAMATAGRVPTGKMVIGGENGGNYSAVFIPDLIVSASIDDLVDHIAATRFQSGSLTAATFQNITNINSTLIFCRATADEFNYSTNPTYTDNNGRIQVIDQGQEDVQRSFTFPTTVGLHDEFGNLLAVAKMSRPIEKNDEKDITFRIRLDF